MNQLLSEINYRKKSFCCKVVLLILLIALFVYSITLSSHSSLWEIIALVQNRGLSVVILWGSVLFQ